jgi:5'-3' exonuclease
VLLFAFFTLKKLSCNSLMVGTSQSRASVDIKATAKEYAAYVSQLLAAHALSGCDTVSCLWGIGKGTILRMLKAGHQINTLGVLEEEFPGVVKEATQFYAACYGVKDAHDMSTIRYSLWSSKMSNTKLSAAPDLTSLPPTTAAFE